jgi:hypothetical protein
MPTRFGGPGVANNLGTLGSNLVALEAGQAWLPPANWYRAILGKYTNIQSFDFIGNIWRPTSTPNANAFWYCDGVNTRLANTSGCAVAALLTAAGTGYTTPPLVVASAGNSTWTAILGQVVSTIALPSGGSNYQFPPEVVIQAPPSPGVQATAFATITAGAVTAITLIDQGAGYTFPPQVTLINDPRDSTGANAIAVASLTGLGTVTAVLCNNHGTPTAGGAVPVLTISGGGGTGAAATAIMNDAVTGYAVTTAGAGYTAAAGAVTISAAPLLTAGVSAYINPSSQVGFPRPRLSQIVAPTSAAGGILVGGNVLDGGSYEAVPTAGTIQILGGNGIVTTAAVVTLTMGGVTDTNYLNPQ